MTEDDRNAVPIRFFEARVEETLLHSNCNLNKYAKKPVHCKKLARLNRNRPSNGRLTWQYQKPRRYLVQNIQTRAVGAPKLGRGDDVTGL